MSAEQDKKLHAAVYHFLVRCGLKTTAASLLAELSAVSFYADGGVSAEIDRLVSNMFQLVPCLHKTLLHRLRPTSRTTSIY